MNDRALSGRTFIVTGANTGIGKETARSLARDGARVVFACRSREKTEPVMEEIEKDTDNGNLAFVELDLADLESVQRAASEILEREPEIHVLINNAGQAGLRGLTRAGFEITFGINHLGPFALTLALFDRIVASAPARIVNVASKAHYRVGKLDFDALRRPTASLSGFPEYGVSKLCNVLFSAELARRLEGRRVTTYSLHPGVIASDIWRKIPWPARPLVRVVLKMKTPEEGAATSLYCATSPEVAGESGRYYENCRERAPSALAKDEALAKELWEKSVEWAGLG
jgi:NAD(P)-dependent dehydrogenase (short-subunit alcohol dehydrogenase family)